MIFKFHFSARSSAKTVSLSKCNLSYFQYGYLFYVFHRIKSSFKFLLESFDKNLIEPSKMMRVYLKYIQKNQNQTTIMRTSKFTHDITYFPFSRILLLPFLFCLVLQLPLWSCIFTFISHSLLRVCFSYTVEFFQGITLLAVEQRRGISVEVLPGWLNTRLIVFARAPQRSRVT